jgi:hypothetical protein
MASSDEGKAVGSEEEISDAALWKVIASASGELYGRAERNEPEVGEDAGGGNSVDDGATISNVRVSRCQEERQRRSVVSGSRLLIVIARRCSRWAGCGVFRELAENLYTSCGEDVVDAV